MLEDCLELADCEKLLSDAVGHVGLMGEIPLSDQDIEKLAGMVKKAITPEIAKGTRILKNKYPASLACFLVGMGRHYDKDSGFWPIVEEKVGAIDINWRGKWGRVFLEFLEQNGLSKFDEEEGLAYVTPILSHTCIPDSCLAEYFERVVAPLVNHELLNPLDHQEIIYALNEKRNINSDWLEIGEKEKKLREKLGAIRKQTLNVERQIGTYRTVATLLSDEDACETSRLALNGLDNAELTRSSYLKCMTEASAEIKRLKAKGEIYWETISNFKDRYQLVLDCASQIDDFVKRFQELASGLHAVQNKEKNQDIKIKAHWAHLSNASWDEKFGADILRLPLDQLFDHISQIQILQGQQGNIQARIEILLASQKKQQSSSIILFLLALLKSIFQIINKCSDERPNELAQLEAVSDKTEAELQFSREQIMKLLLALPIDEQHLERPKIDLHVELGIVKHTFENILNFRKMRMEINEEVGQLNKSVSALASDFGLNIDGNLNHLISKLVELLELAKHESLKAQNANRILETEINPELEEASSEYKKYQAELDTLDRQLAEIGRGSVANGLHLVQEFNRTRIKLVQTRQFIVSRFSDFSSLENELREKGFDAIKKHLEELAGVIENGGKEIWIELQRLENELRYHQGQYAGVDEPTRRFLLYGGSSSEKILIDSVTLFANARFEKSTEVIDGRKLPDRYSCFFEEWWKNNKARWEDKAVASDDINSVTGEKLRAPEIFFDPTAGIVVASLPSQRFPRPEHGTKMQLQVSCCDSFDPFSKVELKLYTLPKGLVKTLSPKEKIPLVQPSEKYIFRLTSEDDLMREWEIEGIGAKSPFLAFDFKTFKQIQGKILPKRTIFLVLNSRLSIFPEESILTKGDVLFGNWNNYVWYEVDLSSIDDLQLLGDGESYQIPLTSDSCTGIELISGHQLAGVFSDDQPVFDLPPESIRIPMIDLNDRRLWGFSIYSQSEGQIHILKHCQIDEMAGLFAHSEGGYLELPLADERILGANPIGNYILRVYKPFHQDMQTTFCVAPRLSVDFDQDIYLPYKGSVPEISAVLTAQKIVNFKTDSPSRSGSGDGRSWLIQIPATEDRIIGSLTYLSDKGEKISIPISINVPKVRWRFQGLQGTEYDQWFDRIEEELWIGDWIEAGELFLLVELPLPYLDAASLVLLGNSMPMTTGKIQHHKVRFDLKALEDRLRFGSSLETVALQIKKDQTSMSNIPLFTIRTRWQAEKIKCFSYPEGQSVRIDVRWEEKGKADQKIVRLWHLSNNQTSLIQEKVIDRDTKEVAFLATDAEVRSGKYLIHLEPYDPWSSIAVCPKFNDPNTIIIEIVTQIHEKAVIIKAIKIDPVHSYPLPLGSYRVHIIGKVINQKMPEDLLAEKNDHILITPLNENWFVGKLEVTGVPEVVALLADTNPVKFEYDTQKHIVTSIEDRHGEGAMYCYKCNMIFWNQETNLNHKHKTYGPIEEFVVAWEAERQLI